jgi:hypothetical protein
MWSYSYPASSPFGCGAYTAYYPEPAYYDPYWYWYAPWYRPEPHHHAGHEPPAPWRYMPLELVADTTTTSRTATVGGAEEVRLSLDYDASAAGAEVKVTIENSDGSVLWDLTGFPTGFHSKKHLAVAAPGSKLTLEVAGGCTARLKWLEKFEDG